VAQTLVRQSRAEVNEGEAEGTIKRVGMGVEEGITSGGRITMREREELAWTEGLGVTTCGPSAETDAPTERLAEGEGCTKEVDAEGVEEEVGIGVEVRELLN